MGRVLEATVAVKDGSGHVPSFFYGFSDRAQNQFVIVSRTHVGSDNLIVEKIHDDGKK
jgi:hypothetical protein